MSQAWITLTRLGCHFDLNFGQTSAAWDAASLELVEIDQERSKDIPFDLFFKRRQFASIRAMDRENGGR